MSSLVRSGLRAAARIFDAAAGPWDAFGKAAQGDGAVSVDLPVLDVPPPPKGLQFDPFAVVEQVGFKDRPTAISFGTLKSLVWMCPVISAVIQARINQGAAFAVMAHDRFSIGYQFRHRDGHRALSPGEKKAGDQISRLLQNTASTDTVVGRDNFEKFLRKIMWDSMVYDQYCFEVVPNNKGLPCAFYAMDAASIRLADSLALQYNPQDVKASRYVQVFDGMVIEEYGVEELCFGVRNPRTEMRLNGYGVSELEMMMAAITALLNGFDYNSRFFSQATMAKGVMKISGAMNDKKFNKFRENWYSMLAGVENAWRVPVLNHDGDMQWINMQSSNRDMEFNSWIDFLIKIACAFYQTDPSEVNFSYGQVGQTTVLAGESNNDKLTESRARGLTPIMRHIFREISTHIVQKIAPELEVVPVGLDALNRSELADLNQKRVKSYYTVDEIRAEEGKAPLPDGKGAIILDPVWMQNATAMAMSQQQQQSMGQGDGGAPDDVTPEQAQDTASDNDRANRIGAAVDANNRVQAAAQANEDDRAQKSLAPSSLVRPISLDIVL